jgi:replication protein
VDSAAAPARLDEHRRRFEHRERWRNQRAAAGLLYGQRVRHCQRSLRDVGVDVVKNERGGTEYAGVLCCDSRWHCPICAAKLTERDRRELQHGMTLWARDGGAVYLLTFTFPHELAMPLRESVEKMQDAQRRMKGSRGYKEIMRAAGALGSVKALEITYGKNGWHPHVHMLVFARDGAADHLAAVRDLWGSAVAKVGLGRINEHGFDCRGGDYAAEYVAKFGREASEQNRPRWSASHELTKGHTKQGERMKGATPFTLLRWYRDGDSQAGALFVEYAMEFKGKAQLFWSPRLRAKLDLFELENPRPQPAAPVKLCHLSREDWHAVLRHNARWEVLYVAERYGAEAVAELVDRMRRSRGHWRGDFYLTDPFNHRPVLMNGPALMREAA